MKGIKFKNDFYSKARGKPKLLNIRCSRCNSPIILYQKDGPGMLKKCYFNRIFAPVKYSRLQNLRLKSPKDAPKLKCDNCSAVIGVPFIHDEGKLKPRLAYRLVRGSFARKSA